MTWTHIFVLFRKISPDEVSQTKQRYLFMALNLLSTKEVVVSSIRIKSNY